MSSAWRSVSILARASLQLKGGAGDATVEVRVSRRGWGARFCVSIQPRPGSKSAHPSFDAWQVFRIGVTARDLVATQVGARARKLKTLRKSKLDAMGGRFRLMFSGPALALEYQASGRRQ